MTKLLWGEGLSNNYLVKVSTDNTLANLIQLDGDAAHYLGGDGIFHHLPVSISFFLDDVASGITDYFSLLETFPTDPVQTVAVSIPASNTLIKAFATTAGVFSFIAAQIIHVHLHLAKTAGTKNATAYAAVYIRNAGGTETLMGTSLATGNIPGTDTEFNLDIDIIDTEFAPTDRLVMKIFGSPVGAGSDPTIILSFEGITDSRLDLGTEILSSVTDSIARSKADSAGLYASAAESAADSAGLYASSSGSKADSAALLAGTDSIARSKADSAGLESSVADSASVSAGLEASSAQSAAVSAGSEVSAADSKATSAGLGASIADSEAVSAGLGASTADSKATSAASLDSANFSTAESKNTSQSLNVSTAQSTADSLTGLESSDISVASSKNVSQSLNVSTAQSAADSLTALESSDISTANSKDTSQSILISTADSKATSAANAPDDSVARSKADSAGLEASTADSKAASAGLGASTADSKAASDSLTTSTADSKAESAGLGASIADSKAVSDSLTTSTADSKAASAGLGASSADSKAASAAALDSSSLSNSDSKAASLGLVESTDISTASSKNVSQSLNVSSAQSSADSAALLAGTDSIARSKADSAGLEASTADSKAVSDSLNTSTADSKGSSAGLGASTADSKAVSDSVTTSTADSKAVSAASAVIGANPTASIGLTIINGVATTFMRSDAAPALDVTIVPTWSGVHTFSNTTDSSSTVTGAIVVTGGIGITKSVTIGGALGVGIAPSAAAGIYTNKIRTDTSGSIYGTYSIVYMNPASASTATTTGVIAATRTTAANGQAIGTSYGLNASVVHEGTGTMSSAVGANAAISNISTGIITTARCLFVPAGVNSGGGSIGTLVGIDVGAQTAGGTNYAIRTSTGLVSFGDTITGAGNFNLTNVNPVVVWGTASAGVSSALRFLANASGIEYIQAGDSATDTSAQLVISRLLTSASTLSTFSVYALDSYFSGSMGIGTASTQTYGLSVSHNALSAVFYVSDASTSGVVDVIEVVHNTSGTPIAGFGGQIQWYLKSSTTATTAAAINQVVWVDPTHATRKARHLLFVYDTAAREALRIEASGTAAMIGFLGAGAVVRQSVGAAAPAGGTGATAGAYDTAAHRDALITLVNNMRTALINLGLCTT